MIPGKRNKYSAQFKLAVIRFAENSNNSAAEWAYGISEKLVKNWNKMSAKLLEKLKMKYSVLTEAKYQNIRK